MTTYYKNIKGCTHFYHFYHVISNISLHSLEYHQILLHFSTSFLPHDRDSSAIEGCKYCLPKYVWSNKLSKSKNWKIFQVLREILDSFSFLLLRTIRTKNTLSLFALRAKLPPDLLNSRSSNTVYFLSSQPPVSVGKLHSAIIPWI